MNFVVITIKRIWYNVRHDIVYTFGRLISNCVDLLWYQHQYQCLIVHDVTVEDVVMKVPLAVNLLPQNNVSADGKSRNRL